MARPHGTKNIATPAIMWELFCAYKEEIKANPIRKTVKGNKDFIIADENLTRPLTMEGFECYLFEQGVIADASDYFENKDNRYSDYIPICRIIKKMIRKDQIEGGMAGIYNPSITQRLNGLKEQTETKSDVKLSGVEVKVIQTGRKQINSEKDID